MSTPARDRLVSYLGSTGWRAPSNPGPAGGLWRHPNSDLLLAVPNELAEDGLDWQSIITRLAEVENAAEEDVEARVSGLLVDIANLRAANDLVIADTIPYAAGVSMVRESWTMLRTCATSAVRKRASIRGNYSRAADEVVKKARMAHTRRGSFIIPIHLPLPAPSPDEPEQERFDGMETARPETEERRVMRTFAESLAMVRDVSVQPEKEPNADDIQDLIRAGVTHEFTAALHRILRQPAVAEFSASFNWAIGASTPPPKIPAEVEIPAAAEERIERVSERLKTAKQPRDVEILTGPIIGVRLDDEERFGTVTVQTYRNSRLSHVDVNVSREKVDEALDWMKARITVVVESRVHRGHGGLLADRKDAIDPLAHRTLGQ